MPGMEFNFTMPMAMRLDETISGVKADVALKIFGEDTTTLEQLAEKAEKALARRNSVLKKMFELKLISALEFESAIKQPLPIQQISKAVETAPYFFDAVRKQMARMSIQLEGAQIYTSLDLDAQTVAQKSLSQHIQDLESNRKNLQKNKEKGHRLEGLVLAAENSTGLVNVVVGGQSYRQTQFNRALEGHRQIGSLSK